VTAPGPGTALVVGATGIVGRSVAAELLGAGWEVHGLSRSGASPVPGTIAHQGDLTDPDSLAAALADVSPTAVAFTAWSRQETEAQNIAVNGAAVRNLLGVVGRAGSLRHVALMTGLKHYLGPFEAYATGEMPDTPFHESEPRLDTPNFYYAQEDELFAAAAQHDFTWSVHRAHTVFGFATGNAMNIVATISAYAAICRELGRPMVFPGSQTQWDGLTDVTDADLLAEQIHWAITDPAAADEPFNIANGDVFRWRWFWPHLAELFGLEWEGYDGAPRPLEEQMAGVGESAWKAVVDRAGLAEPDITRVASWWHTDGDLGRPIEVVTDMNKSRKAGFLGFRDTRDSFAHHLERYREARVLP
jgi:nucleoside-diphosphate-sugar epimerase